MMTLLPYPSFAHSVACLSRAHLGVQRMNSLVMLAAAGPAAGLPDHLVNDPGVAMWRGYTSALGVYATLCAMEWEARGYPNGQASPYSPAWDRLGGFQDLDLDARAAASPPWLGDSRVHLSHQRALMSREPEHYRHFGWRVVPSLNYFWPV